jgi:hypothetical protein
MTQGPEGEEDAGGPAVVVVAPLDNPGGSTAFGAAMQEPLRAGFIEVGGPGLMGARRYIPGDHIAAVVDTTVRLPA